MEATLRRARPDEADVLSKLASRSKAYLDYDGVFMTACRDGLSVTSRF